MVNKRLIAVALQFGDSDSWLEMKLNNETSNNRVNRIQILQIEDEVEYIINNIDFMMDPEIVINSSLKEQRV
jgi:hypothetical protein